MRTLVIALAFLAACKSSSKSVVTADKREAKEIILAVNAHVIVLKSTAAFGEYRDVLRTVEQNRDVIAAQPFIFVEPTATAPSATPTTIACKGVDPARVAKVLPIAKYMKRGTLAVLAEHHDGPPPLLLGDELAKTLAVKVGDDIQLALPADPYSEAPARRPAVFRIAGIFHTGFEEYDQRLSVTTIAALQALVDRGDQVMGIEAIVKDTRQSDATVKALTTALGGPPYQVMDWFELNQAFFGTRE